MVDLARSEVTEGFLHCTKTWLNSGLSLIIIDKEEFISGDVEISLKVADC